MMQESNFEEVQTAQELIQAFLQEADQILTAEDSESIDSIEADDRMAEAIETLAESLYENFDVEAPEPEEVEMSALNDFADFASAFGATLAQLIDSNYANPNEGIATVARVANLSPDEVVACIRGEVAPDAETAALMAAALNLEQQLQPEFLQLAEQAYGELIAQQEEEPEPVAAMSADLALRAEFEALREREAVGETLRQLERQADGGVQNGWLSPYERRVLLGDFEERGDRVVAFSAACTELAVPVGQQLDRVQYYLFVAQQRGTLAFFGQIVDEPIENGAEFSNEDLQAYRRRNGYR